jgi:hypothetical protein
MTAPKTLTRIAGLLYLIVAVAGTFAVFYVRSRIVDAGDAAATADNIRAAETLFRLGFAIDMLAALCWLLTAMVLYLLLKHVHQPAAGAMVTLVAIGVAVSCVSLLNLYTALTIATGDDYTRTFGAAGSDALTLLFTDIAGNGSTSNSLFFGLWLLPLGYLVIRSGYFPKALGVLLIIGCGGWVAVFVAHFLAPDVGDSIGPALNAPGAIAELAFIAWLLVKGVRVPAVGVSDVAEPGRQPRQHEGVR